MSTLVVPRVLASDVQEHYAIVLVRGECSENDLREIGREYAESAGLTASTCDVDIAHATPNSRGRAAYVLTVHERYQR